jgi:hypothetical protein
MQRLERHAGGRGVAHGDPLFQVSEISPRRLSQGSVGNPDRDVAQRAGHQHQLPAGTTGVVQGCAPRETGGGTTERMFGQQMDEKRPRVRGPTMICISSRWRSGQGSRCCTRCGVVDAGDQPVRMEIMAQHQKSVGSWPLARTSTDCLKIMRCRTPSFSGGTWTATSGYR